MSKLYQEKLRSRCIVIETTNPITGEVGRHEQRQTELNLKYPKNGYKGTYMQDLSKIIDLTKGAQRLFFALIDNVDDHNIIIGKWSTFVEERPDNISKAKKELDEAGFIAKIGKVWVLNPFIVLPKRAKNTENQYQTQQIWTRYIEDTDAYYDGIDQDANQLFGVNLVP
jgi:hypothetical protein